MLRRFARMDDARPDAERPRGRGDQEGGRLHVVMRPVGGRELVLDQPVGGDGVRHPQQRLGQHHQGQPFLGRKRIFAQKILDPAQSAGARANRLDEPRGSRIDAPLGVRRARRLGEQARGDCLVGRRIGRRERRDLAALDGMSSR